MNKKLIPVFVGGIVVGIGAGYLLTKDYFNKLMTKRVDEAEVSIKEAFMSKLDQFEKEESSSKDICESDVIDDEAKKKTSSKYNSLIRPYSSETTDYNKASEKINNPSKGSVVVKEDEFGHDEDYTIKTLTRYSDGVIADDDCNRFDNPERYLGTDALKLLEKMGEEELDMFYVKNPTLEIYYEILRSELSFQEVVASDPWLSHKYGLDKEE